MKKRIITLGGMPGSGKSSLTAMLVHEGFRYFSDEVALIERTTFQVAPVPLAFCAKDTGWDLMARYYPEILTRPTHRRNDGKIVRYFAPPVAALQQTSAPVSHIIFPRYVKDAPTELEPVARPEAVRRLMEECMSLRQRLTNDNVQALLGWIGGIDCYALTFSSLERAAELVTRAVKSQKTSFASVR